MRTHSCSALARINGDSGQGTDVRVPEWLMTRLSFGLESSGSPDITMRVGKEVTAESSELELRAASGGAFPNPSLAVFTTITQFMAIDSRTLI